MKSKWFPLFWPPVYEKGIIQDMVVVVKRTHLVALNGSGDTNINLPYCRDLILEEVLTEISIQPIPSYHPSTFEHLSLYVQKHLGQSVAVCGSLWKGI